MENWWLPAHHICEMGGDIGPFNQPPLKNWMTCAHLSLPYQPKLQTEKPNWQVRSLERRIKGRWRTIVMSPIQPSRRKSWASCGQWRKPTSSLTQSWVLTQSAKRTFKGTQHVSLNMYIYKATVSLYQTSHNVFNSTHMPDAIKGHYNCLLKTYKAILCLKTGLEMGLKTNIDQQLVNTCNTAINLRS